MLEFLGAGKESVIRERPMGQTLVFLLGIGGLDLTSPYDLENFERIWAEALFATCHATPILQRFSVPPVSLRPTFLPRLSFESLHLNIRLPGPTDHSPQAVVTSAPAVRLLLC